jgi:hypothetical protein
METDTTTTFLRANKPWIVSFRAGMHLLDEQLHFSLPLKPSRIDNIVTRLFGEERKREEWIKDNHVFSAMMSLGEQTRGFLLATNEQITYAIQTDVVAMFEKVQNIADNAIMEFKEYIFETPSCKRHRTAHMMEKATTNCCVSFSLRYSAARKEMEELQKLCDDIHWFLQLDAQHQLLP